MDENNFKLELIKCSKEEFLKRKERYLKEGLSYYKDVVRISSSEYKSLVKEFDNGNKQEVAKKLFEKSTYDIISATASTYARDDIGSLVPFDEGLSFVLEHLYKLYLNYEFLPSTKTKYIENMIQMNTYRLLSRAYYLAERKKEVIMRPKDIEWIIDKNENDVISLKELDHEDFNKKLNSILLTLKEEDQELIKSYFGLYGREGKSFRKLAKIYNKTHSGVAARINRIIKRLKRKNENIFELEEYMGNDLEA